MVDLSEEDMEKIVKKVYSKIAEAITGTSAEARRAGDCTFGCPNGDKFGCPFSQFKCTGDHFSCAPHYAAVVLSKTGSIT